MINEVNDDDRGSYQPPDKNGHDYRPRSRSPEMNSHRERNRYDAADRISRHDSYASRSDNNYNNNLTSSQRLEVKLFLDKISYFDGSNNKEALNFWAQCEEAAEKMKTSEVTIAWSKLAKHSHWLDTEWKPLHIKRQTRFYCGKYKQVKDTPYCKNER